MSDENQENQNQTTPVPEAFKGTAALADFKDVESLGKAFLDLKSYQGSSIRIPSEDAGDDQRQEFREKLAKVDGVMLSPDFNDTEQSDTFFQSLGKPKDIDGYEFDPIEGYSPNEDKMKQFKELALNNNLTKAQASKMAKTMMEQDMQAANAGKEQMDKGIGELKQEWGMAYDQNQGIALSVAKATDAPEGVVQAMEAGQMDPAMTKWMYSLSKKFEGEGQQLMENQERKMHMTPDEIRGQISDIMENKEHPYYQAGHPDHQSALEKMVDLQRKLSQ